MDHLPPDRLHAPDLSEDEQAHVAACGPCREERRAAVRRGPAHERYEVLRVLGRGGMATVHLVRHRELGTLHALKVPAVRGPRFAARFRTEGDLQRSLRHDHVLAVTEVVELDGEPGLILEYVPGPTLADLLDAGPRLSLEEIDALARGILAGAAAVHARGWVHRDLKPANVLLAITDRTLVPKVADFGLVKVLSQDGTAASGTTTRMGLGTRRYMSLEQLSGRDAEPRMDVFALGAILFELVDRVPAFPTLAAWEEAIRAGRAPSPSRADLPERFRKAIGAALADREHRPADAGALRALWEAEVAAPANPFRPETLVGAARCGEHIPEERVVAGELTPAETEHLSACSRCRSWRPITVEAEESGTVAVVWLDPRGQPRNGVPDGPDRTVFADLVEALAAVTELHPRRAGVSVGTVEEGREAAPRLGALARPGQTLATRAVAAAIRREPGWVAVSHGHWRWAGRVGVDEVFEVGSEDSAPRVPPREDRAAWRIVLKGGAWVPEQPAEGRLPPETDRFIGRERELERLWERVSSGERAIVLHGAAGAGKTRTALHFGWTWLGAWPGGAWFCDLVDARDLDGVVGAVARALEVPLGRADPVVQLGHAIAGRGRALFVLDNFEQVADLASATVGRWLNASSEAVFLITSRVVLTVGQVESLEPLDEAPAVALFVERADAARKGFDWSRERDAVRRLVGWLDGLPLAIELCAARVRLLRPSEIEGRLAERFRLLAGGEGRPDRHETLRQAIDWSHELLTPWQQAAFAQLSVFEGGFTIQAAEAVLELGPEAPWALDAVQALVDRAMVRRVGPDRFGMLASLQAYARERMVDPGPAEARHGRWFARFGTDEALASLDARGGVERWRALAAELDNLMIACRRAVARSDDGSVAGSAFLAAWSILQRCGPYSRAIDLGRGALPSLRQPWLARVACAIGKALHDSGRGPEAEAHLLEAVAGFRQLGDRSAEAVALGNLGFLHQQLGRTSEGERHYVLALAAARDVGRRELEAHVMGRYADLLREQGDLSRSRDLLDQALVISIETGNRRYEGIVRGELGTLALSAGRLAETRDHYETTLAIHREVGNRRGEGVALCNLGLLSYSIGDLDGAIALYQAARVLQREVGDRRTEGIVLGNLAEVLRIAGRADEARAGCLTALGVAREVGDRHAVATTLGCLAATCWDLGQVEEAESCFHEAIREARAIGYLRCEACALLGLARLERALGHPTARATAESALATARRAGERSTEAQALAALAMVDDSPPEAGRASLDEAERIVREIGGPLDIATVLCERASLERRAGASNAGDWLIEAEALAARIHAGPGSELGRRIAEARRALRDLHLRHPEAGQTCSE